MRLILVSTLILLVLAPPLAVLHSEAAEGYEEYSVYNPSLIDPFNVEEILGPGDLGAESIVIHRVTANPQAGLAALLVEADSGGEKRRLIVVLSGEGEVEWSIDVEMLPPLYGEWGRGEPFLVGVTPLGEVVYGSEEFYIVASSGEASRLGSLKEDVLGMPRARVTLKAATLTPDGETLIVVAVTRLGKTLLAAWNPGSGRSVVEAFPGYDWVAFKGMSIDAVEGEILVVVAGDAREGTSYSAVIDVFKLDPEAPGLARVSTFKAGDGVVHGVALDAQARTVYTALVPTQGAQGFQGYIAAHTLQGEQLWINKAGLTPLGLAVVDGYPVAVDAGGVALYTADGHRVGLYKAVKVGMTAKIAYDTLVGVEAGGSRLLALKPEPASSLVIVFPEPGAPPEQLPREGATFCVEPTGCFNVKKIPAVYEVGVPPGSHKLAATLLGAIKILRSAGYTDILDVPHNEVYLNYRIELASLEAQPRSSAVHIIDYEELAKKLAANTGTLKFNLPGQGRVLVLASGEDRLHIILDATADKIRGKTLPVPPGAEIIVNIAYGDTNIEKRLTLNPGETITLEPDDIQEPQQSTQTTTPTRTTEPQTTTIEDAEQQQTQNNAQEVQEKPQTPTQTTQTETENKEGVNTVIIAAGIAAIAALAIAILSLSAKRR